jgi:tungstate transport system ATP-binding protein
MTNAYQLTGLRFQYGDFTALSIDELTIVADTRTALVGANGSGKSTLLAVLAFLDWPIAGELYYFGQRVRKSDLTGLRREIAFLPQKPYLFTGTVNDNLHLALKIRGIPVEKRNQRIRRALDELNIGQLGQYQIVTLSGGERQKAALARAILMEPAVLLMDEPFSYLDADSVRLLERFILEYSQNKGKTVLFSTHNRLQGGALGSQSVSLVKGRPVNNSLLNVFNGFPEKQIFNTGHIRIYLADDSPFGRHIAIDPREIVLSKQALVSSMRNRFQGRVCAIAEESQNIRVAVDVGEIFQALITHHALHELRVQVGDEIWVNFKSNAVIVF